MHEHHHIPNHGVIHTQKVSAQTRRESKSIKTITEHAKVCDSTSQIFGEYGMVKVDSWIVAESLGGVYVSHLGECRRGAGRGIIVAVEINV